MKPSRNNTAAQMTFPAEEQGRDIHVLSSTFCSGGVVVHEKGSDQTTIKGFKRHFARHNYHDYSNVTESPEDLSQIADSIQKPSRGGVHNPFPAVLHRMMTDAEPQKFSHLVSWQPHGRAFLIHDPKRFVSMILPRYFKHSKLSSFQRQLSLYGFVRLTQDGCDKGAYYHELFLRGKEFLCRKIVRTRVKGTWVRTSSSPESEPKFYTMDPVPVGSNQGGYCQESTPITLANSSLVPAMVVSDGDDDKSTSSLLEDYTPRPARNESCTISTSRFAQERREITPMMNADTAELLPPSLSLSSTAVEWASTSPGRSSQLTPISVTGVASNAPLGNESNTALVPATFPALDDPELENFLLDIDLDGEEALTGLDARVVLFGI